MAIQTTSNLANAIRTKYGNVYIQAAMFNRVYDQFATPIGREGVEQASFLANSVQVNFLGDMEPGTSTISEMADVVPSTLRDAVATISPTSIALPISRGSVTKPYLSPLRNLPVFTSLQHVSVHFS